MIVLNKTGGRLPTDEDYVEVKPMRHKRKSKKTKAPPKIEQDLWSFFQMKVHQIFERTELFWAVFLIWLILFTKFVFYDCLKS